METLNANDYEIPHDYIDECGQPITKKKGITYYGCSHCDACFVWDCFCGWVTKKDDYDFEN